MSSCLNSGFSVSGSGETLSKNTGKCSLRVCSSIGSLQFRESKSKEFLGKTLDLVTDQRSFSNLIGKPPNEDHPVAVNAQGSMFMGKGLKWWEKSLQPNMVEINSAQEFVDSLLIAGDKLVIVDFYSPGCAGCKALHPKICQLAEQNQDSIFLMVNYEEHKPMCYALHIHVLPFFRFYRGAEGRLCSFSCTNATINKFKVALAKHGTDRSSLGPARGLDESELLALADADLISTELLPVSGKGHEVGDSVILEGSRMGNVFGKDDNSKIGELKEANAVLMA